MIFGSEQRADVPVEHEVGLPGPLDGLGNIRVCRMDEVPDLTADCLLPIRKGRDIGVDTRVSGVGHRCNHSRPACPSKADAGDNTADGITMRACMHTLRYSVCAARASMDESP